ncbi:MULTISPECIES: cutinase family protein [Nocardia]|uniref:cutinase family protein n=1 Tax=Nocardia TaxID=1817 RepID=UPI0007A422E3|nr:MULTISPECIES: cutinase family protein [Nocardia]
MKRIMALVASLVTTAALTLPAATAAPASADACGDTWSIVVGGLQVSLDTGSWAQDSTYLTGDQRVGYNTLDPRGGVRELDRLIAKHRAECPSDHIKLMGHSMGAAIVHHWVSTHNGFGNVSAILLSDPKRKANGRGFDGLSGWGEFLGQPLGGVDDNFGDIPVLTICNRADVICSNGLDWRGYLFTGAHASYDGNADNYSDSAAGNWFR